MSEFPIKKVTLQDGTILRVPIDPTQDADKQIDDFIVKLKSGPQPVKPVAQAPLKTNTDFFHPGAGREFAQNLVKMGQTAMMGLPFPAAHTIPPEPMYPLEPSLPEYNRNYTPESLPGFVPRAIDEVGYEGFIRPMSSFAGIAGEFLAGPAINAVKNTKLAKSLIAKGSQIKFFEGTPKPPSPVAPIAPVGPITPQGNHLDVILDAARKQGYKGNSPAEAADFLDALNPSNTITKAPTAPAKTVTDVAATLDNEIRLEDPEPTFTGDPEPTVIEPITTEAPTPTFTRTAPPAFNHNAKLPGSIAGAKPRYNYGQDSYIPEFANDLDKAAYITAQTNPSKNDAAYLKFVMDNTGMTEAQVRAYGSAVKASVKEAVKGNESGVVKIKAYEHAPKVEASPEPKPLNKVDLANATTVKEAIAPEPNPLFKEHYERQARREAEKAVDTRTPEDINEEWGLPRDTPEEHFGRLESDGQQIETQEPFNPSDLSQEEINVALAHLEKLKATYGANSEEFREALQELDQITRASNAKDVTPVKAVKSQIAPVESVNTETGEIIEPGIKPVDAPDTSAAPNFTGNNKGKKPRLSIKDRMSDETGAVGPGADDLMRKRAEARNNPKAKDDLFVETAHAQRGAPEEAMLKVQYANGGGVLNPLVEHAGDLTHRMTERNTAQNRGYEFVKEKVDRLIRSLSHPYGAVKEIEENITSNASYHKIPREELEAKVNETLKEYATAHKSVPVHNEVQELARGVAIDIGEKNFYSALDKLKTLKSYLDRGPEGWTKIANEIDDNVNTFANRRNKEFSPEEREIIQSRKKDRTALMKELREEIPHLSELPIREKTELVNDWLKMKGFYNEDGTLPIERLTTREIAQRDKFAGRPSFFRRLKDSMEDESGSIPREPKKTPSVSKEYRDMIETMPDDALKEYIERHSNNSNYQTETGQSILNYAKTALKDRASNPKVPIEAELPKGPEATNLTPEDIANYELWYKYKKIHDSGKMTTAQMLEWAKVHNKVKGLKPDGSFTMQPHRFETLPKEKPKFTKYKLPNGEEVNLDTSATKGADTTSFTLKDGKIVTATKVEAKPVTRLEPKGLRQSFSSDELLQYLNSPSLTPELRVEIENLLRSRGVVPNPENAPPFNSKLHEGWDWDKEPKDKSFVDRLKDTFNDESGSVPRKPKDRKYTDLTPETYKRYSVHDENDKLIHETTDSDEAQRLADEVNGYVNDSGSEDPLRIKIDKLRKDNPLVGDAKSQTEAVAAVRELDYVESELSQLSETSKYRPELENRKKGLLERLKATLKDESGSVPRIGKVRPVKPKIKVKLDDNPISDRIVKFGGAVKSIKSGVDFSAFRQLRPLWHKPELYKAIPNMFRAARSQEFFDKAQEALAQRPLFKTRIGDDGKPLPSIAKKAGLRLTNLTDNFSDREEAIASDFPERFTKFMPNSKAAGAVRQWSRLYKGSNRAFTNIINEVRANVFENLLMTAHSNGETDMKAARDIANFVNNATGRGNLASFEQSAKVLNATFYSPRLFTSRMNILMAPWSYRNATPTARKEAIKAWLSVAGSSMAILEAAHLGGADVELDPRSSDFGKIKIGNTRIDIGGGFNQIITLGARIATGKLISSTTEKEYDLVTPKFGGPTGPSVLADFARSKEAPLAGAILDLWTGKDFVGQDKSRTSTALEMALPMIVKDITDIIEDDPSMLPLGVPAIFGAGVQTYEPKVRKRTRFSLKPVGRVH